MGSDDNPENFSKILGDALEATQDLHKGAKALQQSLRADKPEQVRVSASVFEIKVEEVRPVLDRFMRVLRDAKYHTLESAYRGLLASPGREEDAQQIHKLIVEYQQARALINMAGRSISETLSGFESVEWREAQTEGTGNRVSSIA